MISFPMIQFSHSFLSIFKRAVPVQIILTVAGLHDNIALFMHSIADLVSGVILEG
jgi:hypothetical protein